MTDEQRDEAIEEIMKTLAEIQAELKTLRERIARLEADARRTMVVGL